MDFSRLDMSENLLARTYDRLQTAYLTLGVLATTVAMNALDPQELTVHAGDSLPVQAERAFPSALPTSATALDLVVPLAQTAATIEIARATTSQKELLGMAATAQVLACSADAVADRTWLDPAERAQPDVGFSAISDAWISKLLLDVGDRRRNPFARWGFRAAALVGASYATVGEYLVNGADGGKLDLTSHTAGIVVGVGTYLLEKRKKQKLRAAAEKKN